MGKGQSLFQGLKKIYRMADDWINEPVFAIVDTETTGLNKKSDRIIELGVALFNSNFIEVDRWHTLINPDGKIIKNSDIHGITDRMVENAPTFAEVYTEFVEKIDGCIIIAHNAKFDGDMIYNEVERIDTAGEPKTDVEFLWLDSIQLIKQVQKKGPYSMEALLKRYRLKNPDAHNAAADASATGRVLKAAFGTKMPSIVKQIRKQSPPFNGAHTAQWGLSRKPVLPRG